MIPVDIDIAGGGPGGLFLARLIRLAAPTVRVRVYERNGPDDAFGFGVVFSDRTMASIEAADPPTYELMRQASVSWTDMEVRLPDDARLRFGGYGFTAIARRSLLHILHRQAGDAGADLYFHTPLRRDGDADPGRITVLADGAHSANRDAGAFGTTVTPGSARYIWFGTEASFDAVTFPFVRTGFGAFGAHAYPYGGGLGTFIVETDEATWRAAGLDATTEASAAPGRTDEHSRRYLAELFAEHLGGAALIGNNSKWNAFNIVHNRRWSAGRRVLLGDAAHTAHFSVGSGTKLAMEDAIALAAALRHHDDIPGAFAAYEAARRPPVARTQHLALRSMRWWETFDRRLHMPPHRFGLHFVTRTGAIDLAGLSRRHPQRIADAEAEFAATLTRRPGGHALALPVQLGPLRLPTRIAVHGGAKAVAAAPAAAASLVIVDGAGPVPVAGPAAPTAAPAVLGVAVTGALTPDEIGRLARGAGARLVEVPGDDEADQSAVDNAVKAGDGLAVCAAITCPDQDPWSPAGDRLVARCARLAAGGIAAIHVRTTGQYGATRDTDRGRAAAFEHALAWADRIRTEARVPVLLDGPDGWALSVRRDAAIDDWPTRLHVAVVSGRVDVVVAWPLTVPRHPDTRRSLC